MAILKILTEEDPTLRKKSRTVDAITPRIQILLDDMIDTAGSLCNAAEALVTIGGAKEVYACATHGVLSGPAYDRIEASPIKEMVFLNTIPEVHNTASGKIKFLDVAPTFARAIEHIHGATSIADLF